MNTKLLRQKVLDLAIHGKLVPQNPEHEPASKLLERIRDQNKTYNPITEDEIPFEIPENWCWTKIKDISSEILYGVSESAKEIGKYKLLRITDIQNDSVNWASVPFTDFPNDKVEKYLLRNNDILFARTGGTVGKSYLVENLNESAIYASYLIRIRISEFLNPQYIKYFFGSITYWNQITIKSSGIGQPNVNGTSLGNIIIPLPPLEEQKLIVEEIERIFALIDTVEQNKADLETVIKQTKSKILDLAIHGKLVPQNAADEPASKMLEKLRAEKEEKIANGQLKRDKNDSYIYKSADGKWLERKADGSEEEIEVPFEIPESWSWCHAVDLYNIRSAIRIHKSDWKDKGIPFFRGRDLVELARTGNVHPEVFITEELYELNKSKGGVPQKDDILVSAVGTLGCVHIVEGTKKFYYKDAYILCFENIHNLNSEYIKYVIESDYTHNVIYDGSKGTTIDQLTIENAKALWIPFPPLEEQKRIVKNIDEILNMIEIIMI